MQQKKSLLLKSHALLAVLESALSFYYLTAIPSDAGTAVFAGYSSSRLLLLTGAAVPFLVFGLILASIGISPSRLNHAISLTDGFLGVKWKRFSAIAVSSLLVFSGIIFLLSPSVGFGDFAAIAERLAPLVYLGGFLGVQTLLGQFLWREQKIYLQNLRQWESLFKSAGLLLAFLAVLSIWVSWSKIGLKPETYGWHTPGTPLTSIQLSIALFCSVLFMLFKNRVKGWYGGKKYFPKFETVVFLVLWLAAFLVWQGEPMLKQSYFTPTPTPPNFEYYPFSDAGLYDTTAQNILIGEGRNLEVILRPLYIFFLTLFHLIGGQDYAMVLTLQTLALALMPGLAFLLVSRMGSQSAGVLSAILLIFREKNSIALTNIIEVSHSKLLLSDMPTMAFTLLLVYALVNWLGRKNANHALGIIAGASFGLMVLMRTQAQLLLPILLVGIFFSGGSLREWRKALQKILIFALGLILVVTPWVWRNYQVSGKPAVENTEFYTRIFRTYGHRYPPARRIVR